MPPSGVNRVLTGKGVSDVNNDTERHCIGREVLLGVVLTLGVKYFHPIVRDNYGQPVLAHDRNRKYSINQRDIYADGKLYSSNHGVTTICYSQASKIYNPLRPSNHA